MSETRNFLILSNSSVNADLSNGNNFNKLYIRINIECDVSMERIVFVLTFYRRKYNEGLSFDCQNKHFCTCMYLFVLVHSVRLYVCIGAASPLSRFKNDGIQQQMDKKFEYTNFCMFKYFFDQ